MQKVKFCALVFLCLILAGCGYQNLSRSSFSRSVYFPVLTNRTMQPGAEVTLTNAITEELLRSGIVLTGKEPGYLLSGVVTSYRRTALSFSSVDPKEVSQYRLTVTVHLNLQEFETKTSEVDISTFTDYYLEGPFAKEETGAFGIVAEDLAKRATEWLSEIFIRNNEK